MLNQHIVDRSRYGHHGLRSGGRPARPTNRIDGSYTGPGVPVTVSPDRPEPPNTRNQTHALSGWGEAPLVMHPWFVIIGVLVGGSGIGELGVGVFVARWTNAAGWRGCGGRRVA